MAEWIRMYGPSIVAWFLLLLAPHGRRRQAEPSRRMVALVLTGLAISTTVNTPVVYGLIGELTGIPNLARLLGHAGMLGVAWAGHAFFHLMDEPGRNARAGIVRYACYLAAALVAMAVLFAAAPTPVDDVRFAARYGAAPWVLEYWLVYALAIVPAFVGVTREGLRCARMAATATLRAGLHLVVAGAAVAMAYQVHKAIYFAARRLEFSYPPVPLNLDALLPPLSLLLLVIGTTMPGWGPRLKVPEALEFAGRYLAYRRLRPLWLALYRAVPEIALVPPAAALSELSPVDLRLRLYRRVIEIRDARLALLPYFDPEVAAAARKLAARRGITGRDAEVLAEAAMLAAATHEKERGRSPRLAGDAPTVPGGGDLESDTEFLDGVARAYRAHRRKLTRLCAASDSVGV
ncbi:MAB_1171c family putative transporter [Spongiactinospora sp. 9N601]|uniref:MAB_1171c family putative transporter n=1 Tax=Spongiactinospora sp. 9N601 TaxID=3375149 RepID=UPI0037AB8401